MLISIGMNITEFNRNFIIEIHPSQKRRSKKKLVGFKKMKAIINDDVIFAELLKQAATFKTDTFWFRIQHGLAINLRLR